MQIVIDMPQEFEADFSNGRFKDTLHRLNADAHLLAGNYEQETVIMLINSFANAKILPKKHGDLIDRNELMKDLTDTWYGKITATDFLTIKLVKQQEIVIESEE